jgi:hypothetical protein
MANAKPRSLTVSLDRQGVVWVGGLLRFDPEVIANKHQASILAPSDNRGNQMAFEFPNIRFIRH